mgnify:CR=1 FL=1
MPPASFYMVKKMKKQIPIILLALFVIFISGCKGIKQQHINAKIDPEIFGYQNSYNDFFFETGDGCYYLNTFNNKIYFSERGQHTFYLLCAKPDCSHTGTDCNAYGGYALGYFDGHIYTVCLLEKNNDADSDFYLIEMNPDGTEHKEIARLPSITTQTGASAAGMSEYYFHKGYLYMTLGPFTNLEPDASVRFYRIDLKTGDIERLFEDAIPEHAQSLNRTSFFDDTVYLILRDYTSGKCGVWEASVTDGTLRKLTIPWTVGSTRVTKFGDTLYYYLNGTGYCEYNLTADEQRVPLPADYAYTETVYTEDFIFSQTADDADGGGTAFQVFSRDYRELAAMPLTRVGLNTPLFCYTGTDTLWFSLNDGKLFAYLDLSEIGSDDIKLTVMDDPYDSRKILS